MKMSEIDKRFKDLDETLPKMQLLLEKLEKSSASKDKTIKGIKDGLTKDRKALTNYKDSVKTTIKAFEERTSKRLDKNQRQIGINDREIDKLNYRVFHTNWLGRFFKWLGF